MLGTLDLGKKSESFSSGPLDVHSISGVFVHDTETWPLPLRCPAVSMEHFQHSDT